MDNDIKAGIIRRIEFARSEIRDLSDNASMDYLMYRENRRFFDVAEKWVAAQD